MDCIENNHIMIFTSKRMSQGSVNEMLKNLIPDESNARWWYFVIVLFGVPPFSYLSKYLIKRLLAL
jgi:hypothetical protein